MNTTIDYKNLHKEFCFLKKKSANLIQNYV